MGVSYKRLWKILIDKEMSRADLRRAINLAPNTLTKLNQDQPVNMLVLCRICEELNCDFGDIVEYKPEFEEKKYEISR